MKKAIIYTRAKVDLSDCNLMSITVQAEACKKYADKFDMKVAGLITDIIPIGAERRCVGWDAIVNVKKPYFDFIIVYDYARIGRNVPKLIRQRTKLREKGVNILSVTQPPTNEDGEYLFDVWDELCEVFEDERNEE